MDLARLSDDVEVVSDRYAHAHEFTRDETWFLLKLQEEVGELTQAFLMRTGQPRSKGNSQQELDDKFGAELAVNLEEQVERKWLVWHPDRAASTVDASKPIA
jgi:NTP pyrophosphatase (non-canonical NTP hydrolase)